jgi:nucleotide-binding universal stress UspA family protein
VALQVLRALGEPMVVYRPSADGPPALSKVERIVLPLDGSALSESITPQAVELAKWLGARIVVVSVIEPASRLDAQVPAGDVQEAGYVHARAREIKERYGIKDVGWEVLHGDPGVAIPSFVRSLGDAMLAMSTHGHTGLRGMMAGSVTAQCLRDARVPVFVRLP